jgi:hypothetical protein
MSVLGCGELSNVFADCCNYACNEFARADRVRMLRNARSDLRTQPRGTDIANDRRYAVNFRGFSRAEDRQQRRRVIVGDTYRRGSNVSWMPW